LDQGAGHPADLIVAGADRPIYLSDAGETFPVVVHEPAAGATGLGAVLCPPFGWEDMSSYQPRRAWARHLAAEGVTALRLDLPSTGDSAGDAHRPGRVDAWVAAVAAAAAHLRLAHGCRRVVAIGIGTGGMLALRAAEEGAAIDDLVLWGVASRGRSLLRQMSLFARMEAEQRAAAGEPDAPDDALPDGALAVGGYVLSAETTADLRALDLREPALANAAARHVLLLEQDGIRVDAGLREGLESAGVKVTVSPARGFGKMMLEPQFSRAPVETFATVSAWLSALPAAPGAGPVPDRGPSVSDEMVLEDGVRERFVVIDDPDGDMVGVLAEPPAGGLPVRALLLGGTGHRIGPNRMWVETARRWAARGVPAVRLDLAGVGDAGGTRPPDVPSLYRDLYVRQVRRALDVLGDAEADRSSVSVALCAGAYWAVQASLADERRLVPFMINPGMLAWTAAGQQQRLRRHYRRLLFRRETWRRLRRGEISLVNAPRAFLDGVLALARRPLKALGRGGPPAAAVRTGSEGVLDQLRDQGTDALVVFTGREELLDELERDGQLDRLDQWPNVAVEIVPGDADVHTLRPIWLQHRVHAMLDAALEAELDRLELLAPTRAGA
jgi:pimeloyl-ACP methyl ester carboxylesterase